MATQHSQPITKAEALARFGNNQARLARALGVSRQRVGQFSDGPLPERFDLKLRFVVFPALSESSTPDRPNDVVNKS